MEGIQLWLIIGTAIIMLSNLIGLVVAVYKFSSDPDAKADKQLGINEVACKERHKRLDEIVFEMRDKFKSIDNSILLIKENDIKHIETEMRAMSETQVKILTILEYKDSQKIK